MGDGSKAREALLAAQKSRLTEQLGDVQKYFATIRRSFPGYCSKMSSNIESRLQEAHRCLLDSTLEKVHLRQIGIKGSVTELLALFEENI